MQDFHLDGTMLLHIQYYHSSQGYFNNTPEDFGRNKCYEVYVSINLNDWFSNHIHVSDVSKIAKKMSEIQMSNNKKNQNQNQN